MSRPGLDRFLAPRVFVLTGVVFNILSAVIRHYFIGLNNEQINVIDREIQNGQVLIDSLWQSRTEVERKKEFFILLLADKSGDSTLLQDYYRNYLRDQVSRYDLDEFKKSVEKNTMKDLGLLLDLSNATQTSIIESINATYFETLELQEAKIPLERNNARLFSIAIFLQVTGLILVLARDLRRH